MIFHRRYWILQNVSEDRKTQLFLNKLEAYYDAKYNSVMRQEMSSRVRIYSSDTLADVYHQIIATFPSQYNKLPDVSVLVKAIKDVEAVPYGYLALPDPDYEERKKSVSEEDRLIGKWFVERLFDALAQGNPYEAFVEYIEKYPDKAWEGEDSEKIQELLGRRERLREEKSRRQDYDNSSREAREGGADQGIQR